MNIITRMENIFILSQDSCFINYQLFLEKYEIKKHFDNFKNILKYTKYGKKKFMYNDEIIIDITIKLINTFKYLYSILNHIWIYQCKYYDGCCFVFHSSPKKYIEKNEYIVKNLSTTIKYYILRFISIYFNL